jgi:hypothetical protein
MPMAQSLSHIQHANDQGNHEEATFEELEETVISRKTRGFVVSAQESNYISIINSSINGGMSLTRCFTYLPQEPYLSFILCR